MEFAKYESGSLCVACFRSRAAKANQNRIKNITRAYVASSMKVSVKDLSQKDYEDYRDMMLIRRTFIKVCHEKINELYPEYSSLSAKERNYVYNKVVRILKNDGIMKEKVTTPEMTKTQKQTLYAERWKAKKKGQPLPTAAELTETKIEQTIDLGDDPIVSALEDALNTSKQLTMKLELLLSKRDEIVSQMNKLKLLLKQL